MYDPIVIPTDGSEPAVRAAEHGVRLARTFDATVHLLTVVDVQGAAGVFSAGGVTEEFVARLEAEGEEALAAVEAVADGTDAVETVIRRGRPAETILDYADDHDAGLLAMGTHGRTGIDRYVAGSVTERVVRLADVPVLTVRATERSRVDGGYDEVLIPTDGSAPADAAVDHGIAVARETDARVHAVSVVDVGDVAVGPAYTPPVELRERLGSEAEAATDSVVTRLRAAGVDAVTAVREGLPANALVAYADENDVDLIAMGTHGRTGVGRYLLGSTTERVVRNADVPVMAVKAAERTEG